MEYISLKNFQVQYSLMIWIAQSRNAGIRNILEDIL